MMLLVQLNNDCNGVQREHNKKLNNGLPILHKVPPKRDYGRYFCIMAEKGGTSHGGLTEKISPELRACAVCGKAFLPEGRQAYCSGACKAEGNRRKSRERMRKMREKRPGGGYDLPPRKA